MTRGAAIIPLVLAGMVLGACSAAEPANYDPRDACRRCPPGLLSGTEGAVRIWPGREGEAPSAR